MIELIVGISILVIVSSIVYPIDKIEDYQIEYFSREIVSDIRYIKKKNELGDNNAFISLTYNQEENVYGYIIKDDEEIQKQSQLPKGIKLTYKNQLIKFNKKGTPINCAQTIRIMGEKIIELTITPSSGRVLYKEGIYE